MGRSEVWGRGATCTKSAASKSGLDHFVDAQHAHEEAWSHGTNRDEGVKKQTTAPPTPVYGNSQDLQLGRTLPSNMWMRMQRRHVGLEVLGSALWVVGLSEESVPS